jgi:NAD+ diphosphatase
MSAAVPAFCGEPLDRADHLRGDPAKLAELRADGLLLKLDGLLPELTEDGCLSWSPACAAPPEVELVFLGVWPDGRAAFATVPDEGNPEPAHAQREVWAMLGRLAPDDLAIYGTARSVLDWHARHRFCAHCGQPTAPARAGWQRECGGCGAEHFPRVNPVAIMLVQCGDKLLLGRQARFPPRSYSALAGFMEPGESIEATVRREVFEEAGVRVGEVRYVCSQPWPFPAQLMVGCLGFADNLELQVNRSEIEDARWFTRVEVAEALHNPRDGTFVPPPPQAVARHLLEWWLEETAE